MATAKEEFCSEVNCYTKINNQELIWIQHCLKKSQLEAVNLRKTKTGDVQLFMNLRRVVIRYGWHKQTDSQCLSTITSG